MLINEPTLSAPVAPQPLAETYPPPAPEPTKPGRWHYTGLGLVLLLTTFLHFFQLSQNDYANGYYAAAVKSMLLDWSNFFFGAFDPGGFITVDKPPFALWAQALSAKLLGFSGYSLLLPQALLGIAMVGLLYSLARKAAGPAAGLIAALVLAITPVFVAINRDNNPDTMLTFLLVLAALATTKATETGRLGWLCLAMALVGLAFNTKMLQAYIALPSLYLLYFLAAPLSWLKKILHLGLATLILVIASLWWAVVVDLTPANQRPYIGGSQQNSVLDLVMSYNGLSRITGAGQGPLNHEVIGTNPAPTGAGNGLVIGNPRGPNTMPPPGGSGNVFLVPPGGTPPDSGSGPVLMLGGRAFGEAERGWLRLFNPLLGGEISWLIPLALLGALGIFFQRPIRSWSRPKQAAVLWGSWLLVHSLVFSWAGGIFHSYYVVQLAPAIAVLVGIGLVALWQAYKAGQWQGWLLPIALLATLALQVVFLYRHPHWAVWILPAVVGATLLAASGLLLARFRPLLNRPRLVNSLVVVGLGGVLIAPLIWAVTPTLARTMAVNPVSGPEALLTADFGPGVLGMDNTKLLQFLRDNRGSAKYLVAVQNAALASDIILEGDAALSIGGFSGTDPAITPEKAAGLVAQGEIRYFLTHPIGFDPDATSSTDSKSMTAWLTQNCQPVAAELWDNPPAAPPVSNLPQAGPGPMLTTGTLYDCAVSR